MKEMLCAAKAAKFEVCKLTTEQKNAALLAMAAERAQRSALHTIKSFSVKRRTAI